MPRLPLRGEVSEEDVDPSAPASAKALLIFRLAEDGDDVGAACPLDRRELHAVIVGHQDMQLCGGQDEVDLVPQVHQRQRVAWSFITENLRRRLGN